MAELNRETKEAPESSIVGNLNNLNTNSSKSLAPGVIVNFQKESSQSMFLVIFLFRKRRVGLGRSPG